MSRDEVIHPSTIGILSVDGGAGGAWFTPPRAFFVYGDGVTSSEGDAAAVAISSCALPYCVSPVSLFLHGHIRCVLRSVLHPQHRLFINFTSRKAGGIESAVCCRFGGLSIPRSRRRRRRKNQEVVEAHLRRRTYNAFLSLPSSSSSSSSSSSMAAACNSPPPDYRANVGICLVNDKNEVFVASRLNIPGTWQMPQGGVNEGEDPQAAASRELREETGVVSAKFLGEVQEWLTYDFPPDAKAKMTTLWGKEWTGQAQKWFLFRFTGDESEINLAGDGTEVAEFSEWKWVPVEEVISNAVDFKKPVYEQAFKHLTPLLNS